MVKSKRFLRALWRIQHLVLFSIPYASDLTTCMIYWQTQKPIARLMTRYLRTYNYTVTTLSSNTFSCNFPMSYHLKNIPFRFTAPKAIYNLCYLKESECKLVIHAAKASGIGHFLLDMMAVHRSAILDLPDSWGCCWRAPPRTRAALLSTSQRPLKQWAVCCCLCAWMEDWHLSLKMEDNAKTKVHQVHTDRAFEGCLCKGFFSRKTSFKRKKRKKDRKRKKSCKQKS